MTTQQDREELIKRMLEIADRQFSSKRPIYHTVGLLRRAAALLAKDGKADGELVGYVTVDKFGNPSFGEPNYDGAFPVYTHHQPAQVAQPLTEDQRLACASNIADSILFDLQGRKQLLDGVDEQVLQEIVAEHTSIILNGLAAHGIGKDQP